VSVWIVVALVPMQVQGQRAPRRVDGRVNENKGRHRKKGACSRHQPLAGIYIQSRFSQVIKLGAKGQNIP